MTYLTKYTLPCSPVKVEHNGGTLVDPDTVKTSVAQVPEYEYCFPDNDSEQQILDELKQTCICNMSLCYIKMGSGFYRQAIDYALRVLSDRPSIKLKNKANFRLAQAYRLLDEYDEAIKYLNECEKYDNNSSSSVSRLIHEEKLLLMKQKNAALIEEQKISQIMIKGKNNLNNISNLNNNINKNKKNDNFNIANIFIPLEIK